MKNFIIFVLFISVTEVLAAESPKLDLNRVCKQTELGRKTFAGFDFRIKCRSLQKPNLYYSIGYSSQASIVPVMKSVSILGDHCLSLFSNVARHSGLQQFVAQTHLGTVSAYANLYVNGRLSQLSVAPTSGSPSVEKFECYQ